MDEKEVKTNIRTVFRRFVGVQTTFLELGNVLTKYGHSNVEEGLPTNHDENIGTVFHHVMHSMMQKPVENEEQWRQNPDVRILAIMHQFLVEMGFEFTSDCDFLTEIYNQSVWAYAEWHIENSGMQRTSTPPRPIRINTVDTLFAGLSVID